MISEAPRFFLSVGASGQPPFSLFVVVSERGRLIRYGLLSLTDR